MQQMVAAILKMNESDPGDNKTITQEQYQQWRQQLVFDQLLGLRIGQSFCNRFDVSDNHLFYNLLPPNRLFRYIEDTYIK